MGQTSLKLLQIGAGSMGSRRLRDLAHRDDVERAVFDARPDRRAATAERFGVRTFDLLESALAWKPDALIISSPPDAHDQYVKLALRLDIHHFSEANIWTPDAKQIVAESRAKGLVSASSNSLHFLDVVRELRRTVTHDLGALHAYQMSLSTYMPSWHPDEGPEYYARHRSTAAGREMVPFELLWLNEVFGAPASVSGTVTKRGELAGVVEDIWALHMQLQNGAAGQLTVAMGSPLTCREGLCIGANAIVRFDIMTGVIARQVVSSPSVDIRTFGGTGDREALEKAYFDEINTFVETTRGNATWPLDYHASATASAALAACEASAKSGRDEAVNLAIQPGIVPS
jgi:predicted dehydrogenase